MKIIILMIASGLTLFHLMVMWEETKQLIKRTYREVNNCIGTADRVFSWRSGSGW